MQFTNTVVIDRPVSDVFAFISNFENMPKWNYLVVEARRPIERRGYAPPNRERCVVRPPAVLSSTRG